MDERDALTDEELMFAYQEGDEKAFEVLYRRHSPKVYGYLMKRVRGGQAEDLLQATFAKLHQARRQYNPTFPFMPWLFTVCRSVLIDAMRKTYRTKEELNPEVLERAPAAGPDIEEGSELPRLGSLPGNQREALELRYLQGLSFEEIASRLETSPGNVRQLVSRAVRQLRQWAGGKTQ
jgi:RNA polymerase sigma factor (sigma-70 family)